MPVVTLRAKWVGIFLGVAVLGSVHPASARSDEAGSASADEAARRERSRAAFRRGVAQLRAQDWAGARASFEDAWSLVQHPSILLNLGIARLRTGDPALAEQDLVRFLSEDAGAAPEELSSARDALAEARSKIGTVRVFTRPASARVTIDGKAVAVGAGAASELEGIAEARLTAGRHVVRVAAEGFTGAEESIDLAPKSALDLRVALVASEGAAPAPRSAARSILGWSLAGTSGVALAASGAMALHALSLSRDYADPSSASFQRRDARDEGVAFRTGADVALATGIVAGAAAIVLLLTDLGASRPARVARASPGLRPAQPLPAVVRW